MTSEEELHLAAFESTQFKSFPLSPLPAIISLLFWPPLTLQPRHPIPATTTTRTTMARRRSCHSPTHSIIHRSSSSTSQSTSPLAPPPSPSSITTSFPTAAPPAPFIAPDAPPEPAAAAAEPASELATQESSTDPICGISFAETMNFSAR